VSGDNAGEISGRLTRAMEAGVHALTLEESRDIMEMAGIPFNRSGLAKTPEEAVELAKSIGYPLVAKIVSPQVIHKTEHGGVKVGINSDEALMECYEDMVTRIPKEVPGARIDGVLLEEMVKGTELIIGTTQDPQFGPMIMFGIGGVFVEVYKDVAFRLVPIAEGDARDMMSELKGGALLKGVRNMPGADPEELTDILMKVSSLVDENPQIDEMDINPLMVTERGTIAVDARIILKK
jgi:acyl-CoA synthetase (NDP forming)